MGKLHGSMDRVAQLSQLVISHASVVVTLLATNAKTTLVPDKPWVISGYDGNINNCIRIVDPIAVGEILFLHVRRLQLLDQLAICLFMDALVVIYV